MIFNTVWFFGFFACFYAVHLCMRTSAQRRGWLLAACLLFHYHYAGPAGVAPILVLGVLVFAIGLRAASQPSMPDRRRLSVIGIVVCASALIIYKYAGFVEASIRALVAPSAVPHTGSPALNFAIPLAISFFTFEFIHYLVELYRGGRPITSVTKFALFAIFFPSLVAGPIKRYKDFEQQLDALPAPSLNRASMGMFLVILGYFKKLVIADNAALLIQAIEADPDISPGSVVLLMILLSIRILFDFSGYSDIAIGLSHSIGISLPPNFNFPYAAANISDFWRRWHMSLSSWIRDYVFIPLGGSRVPAWRRIFNLVVAMLICGFWHGAAWHFGMWGLYHGAGLAAHAVWRQRRPAAGQNIAGRMLGILITNAFVAYGWLLFFYPLEEVQRYTSILLGM